MITHSEDQQVQEESGALAVSVDDFAALEDRVRRAVDVVKRERHARIAAEAHAAELEGRAIQAEARHADIEARAAQAQAQSQSTEQEKLQSELSALRMERDQVRQRVERLLAQLDALEL